MADLAKYGEVDQVDQRDLEYVNDKLAEGWELITVKTVEKQYRCGSGEESYIRKEAETHYVLGKPREKVQRDSRSAVGLTGPR